MSRAWDQAFCFAQIKEKLVEVTSSPAASKADEPLPVSDEFLAASWQAAIETSLTYAALSTALQIEATNVKDTHPDWFAGLMILASAASLAFDHSNFSQPFVPAMILGNRRTAAVSDFSDEHLEFIRAVLDRIQSTLLRARLADMLWVLKKDFTAAFVALSAYSMVPLDPDQWHEIGGDCCERSVELSVRLGKATADRLALIRETLTAHLDKFTEAGMYAVNIARLIGRTRPSTSESAPIAQRLEARGIELDSNGSESLARAYYRASADWYIRAHQPEQAIAVRIRLADSWLSEVTRRAESEPVVAAQLAPAHIESALKELRALPKAARHVRGLDEKISSLRAQLSTAGREAIAQMVKIESDPVDITDYVAAARAAVAEKTPLDALLAFVKLWPGLSREKALSAAQSSLDASPLRKLFRSITYESDGRVVSKGATDPDESSTSRTSELYLEMVRSYALGHGLIAQGILAPALSVLQLEQRYSETDFIYLASESGLVPIGHEAVFGKGLMSGFRGDFLTAIHLLAPQVENIVRAHLVSSGVATTTIDANGLENEIGMSSLLDRPEVEQIFGPDISTELDLLFCQKTGPNLRNSVAHGLIGDGRGGGSDLVYAWWFCLRLAVIPFWNRRTLGIRSQDKTAKDSTDDGKGASDI